MALCYRGLHGRAGFGMGNGIARGRTGLPVRGAATTTGMGFAIGGKSGAEKRGPLLQAAGSRQSLVYSS